MEGGEALVKRSSDRQTNMSDGHRSKSAAELGTVLGNKLLEYTRHWLVPTYVGRLSLGTNRSLSRMDKKSGGINVGGNIRTFVKSVHVWAEREVSYRAMMV